MVSNGSKAEKTVPPMRGPRSKPTAWKQLRVCRKRRQPSTTTSGKICCRSISACVRDLRLTKAEQKALDAARGSTLDKALESYIARAQAGSSVADTWPALRTFLEARPKLTGELVDRLARREIPGEAEAGVYIALGNARTPQAREALDAIMKDTSAPPFERTRAMFSLVDRGGRGRRTGRISRLADACGRGR